MVVVPVSTEFIFKCGERVGVQSIIGVASPVPKPSAGADGHAELLELVELMYARAC